MNKILSILNAKSFQEAEEMLQESLSEKKLNELLNEFNNLYEEGIDEQNTSLLLDIIYNQPLTDHQQLKILYFKDFNITNAFFEHHHSELSLSTTLLDKILSEESLGWLLSDLVSYYPLTQSQIQKVIEISISQTDKTDIVFNLINFQFIDKNNTQYLLNKFDNEKQWIKELLIKNQILSDEFIKTELANKAFIKDLIESQYLNNYWVKYFLENEEFQEYYNDLLRYQKFPDEILDGLTKNYPNPKLYSLVRFQPLTKKHKERILESKNSAIISDLFIYQRFSDEEKDTFREKFPEVIDKINSYTKPDDLIDRNMEKIRKRNHYLRDKINKNFS